MTTLSEVIDETSSDLSLSDLYVDTDITEHADRKNRLPQLSFQDESLYLFSTKSGYQGGHIIDIEGNEYRVILRRDQLGQQIYIPTRMATSKLVIPYREHVDSIWILPYQLYNRNQDNSGNTKRNKKGKDKLIAEGFIQAKQPFRLGYGLGSGIVGKLYSKRMFKRSQKYSSIKKQANTNKSENLSRVRSSGSFQLWPIYTSLTLHTTLHRITLTQFSHLLERSIIQYIQHNVFDQETAQQMCWLLNVILYIDQFPQIPMEVMLETLVNFCMDYTNMPSKTILNHPINYIFRPLNIDGICLSNRVKSPRFSISFISTNFEGTVYRTLKCST